MFILTLLYCRMTISGHYDYKVKFSIRRQPNLTKSAIGVHIFGEGGFEIYQRCSFIFWEYYEQGRFYTKF